MAPSAPSRVTLSPSAAPPASENGDASLRTVSASVPSARCPMSLHRLTWRPAKAKMTVSQPSTEPTTHRQCYSAHSSVLWFFAGILRIRSASYGYCAYLYPSTVTFRRSLHAPSKCQQARRAQTPLPGELTVMLHRLMRVLSALWHAEASINTLRYSAYSVLSAVVLELPDLQSFFCGLLADHQIRYRTLAEDRGPRTLSLFSRHFGTCHSEHAHLWSCECCHRRRQCCCRCSRTCIRVASQGYCSSCFDRRRPLGLCLTQRNQPCGL